MLTQAQLEMRKSGIGGSDVSIILGLNPWTTPLELWAQKLGKAEQAEQNDAMEWGSRLEGAVYGKFQQEHHEYGCSYGGGSIRNPEVPHLLSTPDAYLSHKVQGQGILEIKTSGQRPWDEPPIYYHLQCQHYCYNLSKGYYVFAVLFNGTKYREYGPYQFDRDAYEAEVVPILNRFWKSVELKDPTFPAVKMDDLSFIVDVEKQKEVVADFEVMTHVQSYKHLKHQRDKLDEQIKEAKLEIARQMGDAARLVDDEGKVVANQIQTEDTFVVDTAKLKKDAPATFEKFKKVKSGYRSLRVYS